jgi:hypothetical protein
MAGGSCNSGGLAGSTVCRRQTDTTLPNEYYLPLA